MPPEKSEGAREGCRRRRAAGRNDAPEYRPAIYCFPISILVLWSHPPGSNRRPADYESAALPAELGWPVLWIVTTRSGFRNSN